MYVVFFFLFMNGVKLVGKNFYERLRIFNKKSLGFDLEVKVMICELYVWDKCVVNFVVFFFIVIW